MRLFCSLLLMPFLLVAHSGALLHAHEGQVRDHFRLHFHTSDAPDHDDHDDDAVYLDEAAFLDPPPAPEVPPLSCALLAFLLPPRPGAHPPERPWWTLPPPPRLSLVLLI